MKPYYIYILLVPLVIGCSSGVKSIHSKTENFRSYSDSIRFDNRAKDSFIKGSILELKGNYAEAILEYQEALSLRETAGIHNSLAKSYYKLGKLPKALEHSKKAVNLNNRNSDYLMMLASIYSSAHLADSAAIIYDKIIEIDSSNYQAYYYLAQLNEANKPMKALSIYNEMISKAGPDWNVLLRIAELNERLGNVDETISTVEKLLDLAPSNLRLQKLLIESYIKNARYETALNYIDDALALFPDDISLIEYKGKSLIELNRWEEGSKEYLKLIDNSKVPYEAKIRIASAFMNESTKDSSLTGITKNILNEIEKDSSNWQVKAFEGEIAIREAEDSLAVEYFKEAYRFAEWNSQLAQRLAVLLFDNQRYEEVIEIITSAVEKFPDDFVLNIVLGLSLSQQNEHERAAEPIKKAIDLNPTDLTALHAYGFTLNQLDKQREAVTYLKKALDLDPENVQIMGTLGLIYDSLEDFAKSDSIYEAALKIDSTDALVLNNFAYSLSERDLQLERALDMAKKAIEQDPESSSYMDTIGWIYYKLGNYQLALNFIQKAVDKENDNATLIDHLADVYYRLGDKAKAVELWQKALDLDNSMDKVKQKIARETS